MYIHMSTNVYVCMYVSYMYIVCVGVFKVCICIVILW